MIAEGLINANHFYGTINCNGVNAKGDVCGVTTTSGLAWKIPGRVGDSPILGAGLYVDNEVGAAGSTGRGEANLYNLTSYLIVENMRRGMHPKDAGMEALKRIKANTVEKRLRKPNGDPNFNINFYVAERDRRARRRVDVRRQGHRLRGLHRAGREDACRASRCSPVLPRTDRPGARDVGRRRRAAVDQGRDAPRRRLRRRLRRACVDRRRHRALSRSGATATAPRRAPSDRWSRSSPSSKWTRRRLAGIPRRPGG